MTIIKIDNHVERALDRLTEQFKNKKNIENLIRVLTNPIQELEDVLCQLLFERSLDTAEAEQLNVLGRIVGQPRRDLIDERYRRYIRARVRVNRSNGVVEDLIRILRLIVDDTVSIVIQPDFPAALFIELLGPVSDEEGTDLFALLVESISGGIRLTLQHLTTTPEDSFQCSTLFASGGSAIPMGAPILSCVDPRKSLFPPTGTLIVDAGTAAEEIVTYTLIQAFGFTVDGLTTIAHTAGFSISLHDFTGKGFGTTSDPLIGGQLTSIEGS